MVTAKASLAPPASHGACRHCLAWVEPKASHCPVCGIVAPLSRRRSWPRVLGSWADAFAVIGAVCGLGIGIVTSTLVHAWWSGAVTSAALVGLGALVAKKYGGSWAERTLDSRKPRSLLAVRDELQARIAVLHQSGQRIGTLRARIAAALQPAQAESALAVLEAAAQACMRQQERLNADAWRVALAQWQNQLQPALYSWRHLDATAAEHELTRMDRAGIELQRLRDNWRHSSQAHSESGKQVLAHASHLADACDALKRALLLRQAMAMAAQAPGIDQAFSHQTTPSESMEQLDILRQTEELGDYLSNPAAANDEAVRLHSEQQAMRELERMLSAPGPIAGQ